MYKKLKQIIAPVAIFISRLGMLPANFSPVGSYGFFSAQGKSTVANALLYLMSILAFDYLVGGFYKGFIFTYVGFAIYFLLGKLAKNSLKKQALFLPLASFLFFLVSNFGVWYYWYPHSIEGLATCYMVAIPFYKMTLLGDVVFGYGVMAIKLFNSANCHKLSFRTCLPTGRLRSGI